MTVLCGARVSLSIPRCNAPASPASDRECPLCERCLRVRDEVDRRWGHKARRFVPPQAAIAEAVTKKGPAKQSSADEELFAAMKRAMANGFAKHEPAFDDEAAA